MAQSLKDIRRRMASVRNIRKITQAMKMVAASKLRRAQARAEAARPYATAVREVLVRLSSGADGFQHPFLQERPLRASLAVVVTSDRGLAGAYNANLTRAAQLLLRDKPSPQVVAVGRKGRDYFRRRGYRLAAEYVQVGDEARYALADEVAREVTRLYREGACDEVFLVYAQFINALQSRPVSVRLLPLTGEDLGGAEAGGGTAPAGAYIFEPDAGAVLERLLPHYISILIYRALLEAKASEQGARMAAMDNATKNAAELIDHLTLTANRLRQAAITKEIAEIVGGANALQG
jgi:F-type H+-transporting ATPase subunit gamma